MHFSGHLEITLPEISALKLKICFASLISEASIYMHIYVQYGLLRKFRSFQFYR